MDMHNVGIREMVRRSDQHLCGQGRGIAMDDEGFRTLSRVNDKDLLIEEPAASSRFEWNHLLNDSRRIPVFDGVERGSRRSREVVSGRNYDGLVERSLPNEIERARNVPDYGPNVGVSEHRESARNVSNYGPDVRVSENRESARNVCSYGPDVRVSEHRESARNVTGLPVLDSGDLRVRVREYPPRMERETLRQPYNEGIEGNGVRFRSDDGSLSLTPRSHSSGGRTPLEGISRGSLEGLGRDIHHRLADGSVRGGSIPSVRHNSFNPRSHYSDEHAQFDAIPAQSLDGLHQEIYPHCDAGFESSGSIPSSRGNNYRGGPYSSAGGTTQPFPSGYVHFPRVRYSPDEGRSASYIHQEIERSQNVYQREPSRDGYEDIQDMQEYCDQGDAHGFNAEDHSLSRRHYTGNRNVIPRSLSRDGYEDNQDTMNYYDVEDANVNNVEDAALHRHRYTGYSDGSVFLDNRLHPATQPIEEALSFENCDHSRAVYETGREYDREMLNTNFGQTSDDNYETLHYQERYGYQTDPNDMLCEGQNLNIPTVDEGVLVLDERGQQYACLLTPERPKKMLKRKHAFGKDVVPSFRSISCRDKPLGIGTSNTEDGQSFGGLSLDLQRRLCKPSESVRGDLKKRLKHPHSVTNSQVPHLRWLKKKAEDRVKPSPNAIHATSDIQKFGKAKGIGSNKKKPKTAPKSVLCPSAAPNSHVLQSGHNSKKPQKSTDKDLEITKETPCSQPAEPEHSILKVNPASKDLPEDSDEFRRQVDMWFLKSMLHLNANIGQQRKFKEQTKGGAFKCIICSSSTEFPDTKGVAKHAFTSPKVGYRAPHLGFHKALCVLMGWDSGAVAQNGRWTCQSLPEIEAWILKEDIIIWPPVLFIHDISVRNYSHNKQAKVPEDQLTKILKGMGLSDGNTKVCCGKSGNLGILVVKFSGTLSGLKEAQRLHDLFAGKKHGRAELLQMDAGGHCCKGVDQTSEDRIDVGGHCCEGVDQKSEDKIQDQLYGYLGIIEDLHKLNYDMRRHYRGRSKKEILASVEAAP